MGGDAEAFCLRYTEAIPPADVVAQLEGPAEGEPRLLDYLHAVFLADVHLCAAFHGMQLGLYGKHAPHQLMPFLKGSPHYPLELALETCREHGLVAEQVYVLGRMGAHREALALMLAELEDIEGAVEFVRASARGRAVEDPGRTRCRRRPSRRSCSSTSARSRCARSTPSRSSASCPTASTRRRCRATSRGSSSRRARSSSSRARPSTSRTPTASRCCASATALMQAPLMGATGGGGGGGGGGDSARPAAAMRAADRARSGRLARLRSARWARRGDQPECVQLLIRRASLSSSMRIHLLRVWREPPGARREMYGCDGRAICGIWALRCPH